MRMTILPQRILLLLAGLVCAQAVVAHAPLTDSAQKSVAPWVGVAILLGLWLMYVVGSLRVRPGWVHQLCWHSAMLLALFTLLGPLDSWAETDAAMHMTQHMVMIVVIAPLWVLAQPWPQLAAGGPRRLLPVWLPLLRLARRPLAAAWAHAGVIWAWHSPRLYLLALEDEWWHLVEHGCFLLTAGWFWWSILRVNQKAAPRALLALLFTLMHTGFLGAFLTFAHTPLYGAERGLVNQQLAGLIMWVLGGVPYLGVAAWVGLRWFQQTLRREAVSLRD